MAQENVYGKLVNVTDGKLADASQIIVSIDGVEKSIQSAIDNDEIGGSIKPSSSGGQTEALTSTQMDATNSGATKGSASYSFIAGGYGNTAHGIASCAEGSETIAGTSSIHVGAHAEGYKTHAYGTAAHAEGNYTEVTANYAHAEGNNTIASGESSHSEGKSYSDSTIIIENVPAILAGKQTQIQVSANIYRRLHNGIESTNGCKITSGFRYGGVNKVWIKATENFDGGTLQFPTGKNVSSGEASHTEGIGSVATGYASHSEGYGCVADEDYSHAEGKYTKASGSKSHAEGYKTIASSEFSHAEGSESIADAEYAHAEGDRTNANGLASHAEGICTIAKGAYSHAEGAGTNTIGQDSHAEGTCTITNNQAEHSEGMYNVSHTDVVTSNTHKKTRHSVGIGTSTSARKNAHEIMENGDHYFGGGKLYKGEFGTDSKREIDKYYRKIMLPVKYWAKAEGDSYSIMKDSSSLTEDYNIPVGGYVYPTTNPTLILGDSSMQIYSFEAMQGSTVVGLHKVDKTVIEDSSWKTTGIQSELLILGTDDEYPYIFVNDNTTINEAMCVVDSKSLHSYNTQEELAEFQSSSVSTTYDIYVDSNSGNCMYDFRCLAGTNLLSINLYLDESNPNETTLYIPSGAILKSYKIGVIEMNEEPTKDVNRIISIQSNIIIYGSYETTTDETDTTSLDEEES